MTSKKNKAYLNFIAFFRMTLGFVTQPLTHPGCGVDSWVQVFERYFANPPLLHVPGFNCQACNYCPVTQFITLQISRWWRMFTGQRQYELCSGAKRNLDSSLVVSESVVWLQVCLIMRHVYTDLLLIGGFAVERKDDATTWYVYVMIIWDHNHKILQQ